MFLPFTPVYTRGVGYRFDEHSYDTLAAAGITWREVLHVLGTPPRVRHHIGAVLRIAGQTQAGRWIGVSLIEERDDDYLVVAARDLDEDEITAAKRMLGGEL